LLDCDRVPVRTQHFVRFERNELAANNPLECGWIAGLRARRSTTKRKIPVLGDLAPCRFEDAGHVGIVFDRVLFEREEFHFVEHVIDRVLDRGGIANRRSRFRLENMKDAGCGQIAVRAVVQKHALEVAGAAHQFGADARREIALRVARSGTGNASATRRVVGRLVGTAPCAGEEFADDGKETVHLGRYPSTSEVAVVRRAP